MKTTVKFIVSVACMLTCLGQSAYGYMFGFKSWDNTPENIIYTEKTYGIELPVV